MLAASLLLGLPAVCSPQVAEIPAGFDSDGDWIVPAGQTVQFDTGVGTINGKQIVGGVVHVRNFRIESGATLTLTGPNPFVLSAWGQVRIDGLLDLSGTSSLGVQSVTSASVPEPGAPGQAGGGDGGVGSPATSTTSLAGGPGEGAFGLPGQGGGGGETGYAIGTSQNARRRGGGGGGGRFGHDQLASAPGPSPYEQSIVGLDAEPGFSNPAGDYGAIHGVGAPWGGTVGPSPFVDANPANDFFGWARDRVTGELVHGELKTPWAGSGGGGGGDSTRLGVGGTFPPPFLNADLKGAGGGGGAGSCRILSLGSIAFGPAGSIRADGGNGGGGDNTLFLNRLGGGSGGGSGGHVILESAVSIDLSAASGVALQALGGQGGAGEDDVGGASFYNGSFYESPPTSDACPESYWDLYASFNPCRGHVEGAGGDGSPGVIQLHTPSGLDGVLLPVGRTLADICLPTPVCSDDGPQLVAAFSLEHPSSATAQPTEDPPSWLRFQPGVPSIEFAGDYP